MGQTLYVGKKLYAIFSNALGQYVQPCTITNFNGTTIEVERHNGGKSGHEKGTEFFNTSDIGKNLYYSNDSAAVNMNKKIIEEEIER